MPRRTKQHILETVAAKAFEKMLHPSLVVNPLNQGKDYGIDYRVQTFGEDGQLFGGFDVQVKYLPQEDVRVVERFPNYVLSASPRYVSYPISIEHLETYLNPQVSPSPTLFVLANERDIFYIWVNDLHKYYLRWMPQLTQGTRTIYFCDLHSLARTIGTWYGNPQTTWPNRINYENARESFMIHDVARCGEGWLTRWVVPGTVDSLVQLGFGMQIQNAFPRTRIVDHFDAQGFFDFLQLEEAQRPWIFIAFAHFLGMIKPTESMLKWALVQLQEWKNGMRIPAAYQILSQERDGARLQNALATTKRPAGPHNMLAYERLFDDVEYSPRMRFLTDYIWARANFLSAHVMSGSDDAKEQLVRETLEFEYSYEESNTYADRLTAFLNQGHTLGKSCTDVLSRVLDVNEGSSNKQIIEAIKKFDWNQWEDRRNR